MRRLGIVAVGLALLVGIVACTRTVEKAVVVTPTPAGTPTSTVAESAYLREASRLIRMTNIAIDDVNDLIEAQTYNGVSLYGIAFSVYAEQWRENEPPESYRNRHDVVQHALDRLEQVGNQAAKGRLDVTEMIVAGSTFKSAAEDFEKPVP